MVALFIFLHFNCIFTEQCVSLILNNYYQKQKIQEDSIPHGCRLIDLDALRNV